MSLLLSCGASVPAEIRQIVFESDRFATITLKLPPQASRETVEAYRRKLQRAGLIKPLPLPGDVRISEPGIMFLLRHGFITVDEVDRNTYPYYTDKVDQYGQFDKYGRATITVGKRRLQKVTYTNKYKANPLGLAEVTVFALTFTYSLEAVLPDIQLPNRDFEGKAKAYLDPDDGKWKLDNLELSDHGVKEFFEAESGSSTGP